MKHVRVVINYKSNLQYIEKQFSFFVAALTLLNFSSLLSDHINVNVYTDCHLVLARQINWKLEK